MNGRKILLHVALASAVASAALASSLPGADAGSEAAPQSAGSFDPGLAGYEVVVGGIEVPYRVMAFGVLPGETLSVEVRGTEGVELAAPRGTLASPGPGRWRWTAPSTPGLVPLDVRRVASRSRGTAGGSDERSGSGDVRLQVFVMRPASEARKGRLAGYHIGRYPDPPQEGPGRGQAVYQPPRGFVEVTPELLETAVSPHFRLEQFLCKQESGFPKYLVLRTESLLKLERILQHVNAEGIRADTLAILSGYRTPVYNRAIHNVPHSRHLWGGATDIFVDVAPADGRMDDLDGDGRVDERDARRLSQWVEELEPTPWYRRLLGGIGSYGSTAFHGPFVHVDVRGWSARW